MASKSRVVRAHSAIWARRSSGLIFPAIGVFFPYEAIKLLADRHQHANDAIDGLAVENRLMTSPHGEMIGRPEAKRKVSG
jgi:hypothetical protein